MKTGNPRGWIPDPAKRHARAVKAGEAARRAHQQRAYERAGHLHPIAAYAAGYKTGYNRAWHFWKAWAVKQTRGAA